MHTPRRLVVLLAALGLVALAGCAADDGDGSLAVGDDPPVTGAAEETVPSSDAAAPDTVAPDTVPAWDDVAAAEDTTPASDEDQIRYAFETWIVFDTPADVRASLLEDGEAQEAAIQAGFEEHEAIIWDATIEVDTVTLLDDDHADVVFRVLWGGRPSPYFPEPVTGSAVRVDDGTWRVSRATLCQLFVGTFGTECASTGPVDPSTTAAPPATAATGPQPVVLFVSNQSFAIPEVDRVVTVDGVAVADQTFSVDQQHTFVRFDLSLEPGTHDIQVEVVGDGTATGAGRSFEVDDPEWITAFHWDDGQGGSRFELATYEDEIHFL